MSARCKHFGVCGGCQTQDVDYEAQVARKSEALQDLLRLFWAGPIPVAPSPVQWGYRNKVDFTFGLKRYPEPPPPGFVRDSVLGYKARGRWYHPLDIEECHIAPEGAGALLASVRAWMRQHGLRAFDSRRREGFLRALLVREGRRTGQRMAVLITADGPLDGPVFVEAVRAAYPADSIQRGIFRGLADVAHAEELEMLHGAPWIEEELRIPDTGSGGAGPDRVLRFRLSPLSFFQTNTLGAERLYGMVRQWVRARGPETLYDLYGGMGCIALACADLATRVYSVESVASASEDGRFNAAANEVGNVDFVTEPVEAWLKDVAHETPAPGAVVVDPPRSGLHPKALGRLLALKPPHVLYISCKPEVFARELPALLEAYRIEDLRAVDLFPHTGHVELLASLATV